MFSELDGLSGGREGGASTRAPDDVPPFSPNLHRVRGLPRRRQRRTASNSCWKSGSLTRATQFGSRAIGQGDRSFPAGLIFAAGYDRIQ